MKFSTIELASKMSPNNLLVTEGQVYCLYGKGVNVYLYFILLWQYVQGFWIKGEIIYLYNILGPFVHVAFSSRWQGGESQMDLPVEGRSKRPVL